MKKLHKYNVGDELTIKISAIREKNGKIAYDIEGLNGLSFVESTIDNIAQKKIKPGDTVFGIYVDDEECRVCIDKYKVEDIGHYEVKVHNNWLPMDDSMAMDEVEAEQRVQKLADMYGYIITRNNWTGED